MAVTHSSAEDICIARLNSLLRRARDVHTSTAVDRPLQVSALISDSDSDRELISLGSFASKKEEKNAAFVRDLAIESAAKRIFYGLLGSTKIEDPDFIFVWNLLDILQYYGDRELCAVQLVLVLIEELLDSLSLTECRIVLTFLESRRETLIASKGHKSRDLVILRLCNELLRRQSRAEDPVFCGRVYIFMFQIFPLGDKSSVNLRGLFHVENVTTFEDYLAMSTPAESEMNVDSKDDINGELQAREADVTPTVSEPTEHKPTTMDIDALYPVFWSLQHCFSDPTQLFEEGNFKKFKEGLEASLAKFKQVPKVIQTLNPARETRTQWPSDGDHDKAASASNPKYLTSRDLFKLELSDLAFQRHILVQALIMVEFLLTLTEKAKSKPYYQDAQSRMQYDFTLNEENTEWALGIKYAIANYLQDGPDGKFYYRMVDTVLSRDKNWVRWKMRSCKPFTRPRVPAKNFQDSKSGSLRPGNQKKVAGPTKAAQSLLFLSKAGSAKKLSQLKHNKNFKRPGPDKYALDMRNIEVDLDMAQYRGDRVEEIRQQETKTSLEWRSLRLSSINQLKSFDKTESLEKPSQIALSEATNSNAPTAPETKDSVPQEYQPSVEEQWAG